MVKAIIELPNGKSVELEVSGNTRLIDVVKSLKLNDKEVLLFCGIY